MKSLSKSDLRKIYTQKRQALTDDDVALLSYQICKNIIRHFLKDTPQNIHLFLPIDDKKEVSLWDLIRHIWGENLPHQLFIPKVVGNDLINFPLTENTILQKNHWGILEPVGEIQYLDNQFDMIITPLLYADKLGNRIGYGKGFYDRFFGQINHNALKIGVNFFNPDEKILDVYDGDIPLDFLVTPSGGIKFD